ncbi:hypothetical protein QHH03_31570, partial [Aphanizomenon sp. 202]|nr:hypothetical protein [Aphanizomenon sp. 202]
RNIERRLFSPKPRSSGGRIMASLLGVIFGLLAFLATTCSAVSVEDESSSVYGIMVLPIIAFCLIFYLELRRGP